MKILILGSGGREHALALTIARSARVSELYCAPGNAGTLDVATNVALDLADLDGLVAFAQSEGIDLTIVGPEAPLVAGIVDRFQAAGLRIFGPNASAARLEGSKAFAKAFMQRHGIPTAGFAIAHDVAEAKQLIEGLWRPDGVVIKADGLAAGKGVVVASSRDEALTAVERMMVDREFGEAGGSLVIEQRLSGPEVSVLACLDGETWWAMPPAQDHKALLDGDLGPNTGGMGAYSPVPQVDGGLMHTIATTILDPIVEGLKADGIDYRGILFVGFMLTPEGPQVLEFNCRFGDPETQVLLSGLRSDLVDLIGDALNGTLVRARPAFDTAARICVVAAAPGYPGRVPTGLPITGLDAAASVPGVHVLHAGTAIAEDGSLVTAGGRVLNVVAEGSSLAEAAKRAYEAMAHLRFGNEPPIFRTDIGRRAMVPAGSR